MKKLKAVLLRDQAAFPLAAMCSTYLVHPGDLIPAREFRNVEVHNIMQVVLAAGRSQLDRLAMALAPNVSCSVAKLFRLHRLGA